MPDPLGVQSQQALGREGRAFVRIPMNLVVRFRFLASGAYGREASGERAWRDGLTEDLSGGGLLLRGSIPRVDWLADLLSGRIPVGVALELPDGRLGTVQALSRVAWLEGLDVGNLQCRLGLRFQEISPAHQERILDFVLRYGATD